jgi:hypothetical protein
MIMGDWPIERNILLAWVGGSHYLKFPQARFSRLLEAVLQYVPLRVILTRQRSAALQTWSGSLPVRKLSWRSIGRGRGPYVHLTLILSNPLSIFENQGLCN